MCFLYLEVLQFPPKYPYYNIRRGYYYVGTLFWPSGLVFCPCRLPARFLLEFYPGRPSVLQSSTLFHLAPDCSQTLQMKSVTAANVKYRARAGSLGQVRAARTVRP